MHLSDDLKRTLTLNPGGHQIQIGKLKSDPKKEVRRSVDLYKFFPEDYKPRWVENFKQLSSLEKFLIDHGLNFVNNHTTPVIIMTPYHGNP